MEKSEKTDPPNEILNTKRAAGSLEVSLLAILIFILI